MPWCPICRTEYREGFTICSDCEAELVEELDAGNSDADELNAEIFRQVDWEYLDIFIDDQEATMIESFLNSDNIQTWKKYPGFSDISKIVGGMTRLGVAIYVPRDRLDDARLIVEDILGSDRIQEHSPDLKQYPDESFMSSQEFYEPDTYPGASYTRIIIFILVVVFLYLFFSR